MITADIIAHSKHKKKELISIETYAPKYLDAEIEKHRMLSSNSSSDRAIPLERMLEKPPFLPKDIRRNQRGMQGDEKLSEGDINFIHHVLNKLYEETVDTLRYLSIKFNVHKQHLNRYLLGFSMQKKIITGTKEEWDYFLNLRLHPDADPAIYDLANKIDLAIRESKPKKLKKNQWHLPYIRGQEKKVYEPLTLCKISAARCARVSYDNHDGSKTSVDKDLELFKRLTEADPPHMSPLDHQGLPIVKSTDISGTTYITKDGKFGSGNFKNWIQFRHHYLNIQKETTDDL